MPNTDFGSLVCNMKQQVQQGENTLRSAAGNWRTLFSNEDRDGSLRMTETRIYVGLNDAESREQKFDTQKYLGLLKNICRSHHVAFSVDIEEGGYFHEDGEYTEETSLILILINADRDLVQEISKDLCTIFRQESVLVTEDQITGRFVHGEALE